MNLVSLKNTLKLKLESEEMQFVCAFSHTLVTGRNECFDKDDKDKGIRTKTERIFGCIFYSDRLSIACCNTLVGALLLLLLPCLFEEHLPLTFPGVAPPTTGVALALL